MKKLILILPMAVAAAILTPTHHKPSALKLDQIKTDHSQAYNGDQKIAHNWFVEMVEVASNETNR